MNYDDYDDDLDLEHRLARSFDRAAAHAPLPRPTWRPNAAMRRTTGSGPGAAQRWRVVTAGAAAAAVIGGGVTVAVMQRGHDDGAASPVSTGTADTGVTGSIAPAPVTTVAPTSPPTTEAPTWTPAVPDGERTSLSSPIGQGMSGEEVTRLQERLAELKFDPGPIDGQYGSYTIQAVWAFEKLVLGVPRDEVTSVVTDEIWQRMQDALDVQPYRKASEGQATTDHTEVYLPLQVVVFFQDDEPVLIAHISSGTDELWREEVTVDPGEMGNDTDAPKQVGYMALAHTPGGVFTYTRFVEGRRQSVLGGMYDPAYFNYGIAIHGADNVPSHPASHGCIRINKYLGAKFHDYVAKDDQVFVWNMAGDEPEDAPNDYPWNRIDPDSPLNTTTTAPPAGAPATPPPVVADPAATAPA